MFDVLLQFTCGCGQRHQCIVHQLQKWSNGRREYFWSLWGFYRTPAGWCFCSIPLHYSRKPLSQIMNSFFLSSTVLCFVFCLVRLCHVVIWMICNYFFFFFQGWTIIRPYWPSCLFLHILFLCYFDVSWCLCIFYMEIKIELNWIELSWLPCGEVHIRSWLWSWNTPSPLKTISSQGIEWPGLCWRHCPVVIHNGPGTGPAEQHSISSKRSWPHK